MQVCFRVDVSAQLGLGHLRRCLSLAQALRRCGAAVSFIVGISDVDGKALVNSEGFAAQLLNLGCPSSSEADADASVAALAESNANWVVVDHYDLDATWHDRVRAATGAQIAVIDDLADRPIAPDALIDHNLVNSIGGHSARYESQLKRQPHQWAIGPRFALLSPAYDSPGQAFTVREHVESVGIFLGGTAPAHLIEMALDALRNVAGFRGSVEVVSTSANPTLPKLRDAVARDRLARLSIDLPDLRSFYSRHDLQVGAGGGAAWERCAIGVPTLTLAVVPNQLAVVPSLAATGATSTVDNNSAAAVGSELRRLICNPHERLVLSERSRAIVDGRGALRCALTLLASHPGSMTLRSASNNDSRLMWTWRNHPITREMSRNPTAIDWSDHQTWMQQRLAMPEPRLWIGMVGSVEIGVIRFDRIDGRTLEVSLYLDPGLHGLGLGRRLLDIGELAVTSPVCLRIQAEVLAINGASSNLFTAAGYRRTGQISFEKLLPGTHNQ